MLQSYFRLEDGRLSSQRRSPKTLASQRDLYNWVSPYNEAPTELEKGFFQQLDSKAARAASILCGPPTLGIPTDVFRDWARFLTATVVRTPFALEGWRFQLRKSGEELLGKDLGLLDSLLPGWLDDMGLKQIVDFLSSDQVLNLWKNMRSWMEDTDGARYRLLTSDSPGVGQLIGDSNDSGLKLLLYPLSPNKIFCATEDPVMAHLISSGTPDFVVNWSNNLQIKYARKHLFAADDSLKWHIEKYFGDGFPDPPLPQNT
jgi:hypothetical protein